MWFLAILLLLNAALDNNNFVNKVRIDLLGFPINIIDVLLIVGLLIALFRRRHDGSFAPSDKSHPAFTWAIILYLIASVGAFIGTAFNEAPVRAIITSARNFLALPAGVYIGYFLTSNFKSSRRFAYISILAGLAASMMIMIFFREKGSDLGVKEDVINVRAVAYVSAYAALAVALLIYSLASGDRLFPLPIALFALLVCMAGAFFTLSRSDWLAAFGAVTAMYFLLPKGRRGGNFVATLVAIPVLIVGMWIGLYVGTQITGKDMFEKMYTRLESMLPGDRPGVKKKAWESRLPGIKMELAMFLQNPILGGGIAIQDAPAMAEGRMMRALRHCSWTAVAAESGIFGLTACIIVVVSMVVVGRRLVRDRYDKGTVLIGALGVAAGVYYILHGASTMSFNQVRWGLPMTIVCGVVLRTRAIQLTQKRLALEAEHTEQWAQYENDYDGYDPGEMIIPESQSMMSDHYQHN